MYNESRFNPNVGTNAKGLMQITPVTWRFLYEDLQSKYPSIASIVKDDPYDTTSNISLGIYYFKYIQDYYGLDSINDNYSRIISTYACGEKVTNNRYEKTGSYNFSYVEKVMRVAEYIRTNKTWKEGM